MNRAHLFVAAAICAPLAVLAGCFRPAAEANAAEPEVAQVSDGFDYGARVFADPETGCQYITYAGRYVTPRYERGASGLTIKGCRYRE